MQSMSNGIIILISFDIILFYAILKFIGFYSDFYFIMTNGYWAVSKMPDTIVEVPLSIVEVQLSMGSWRSAVVV